MSGSPSAVDRPDAAGPGGGFDATRTAAFHYDGFSLDAEGTLACRYRLDDWSFEERTSFGRRLDPDDPTVRAAARLVFLLAGISYYKAGAPPVVDLGEHALTAKEARLLRAFYVDGLGEYAHRNGLDLTGLRIEAAEREPRPATVGAASSASRPLVPFGGGIDSIVTVDEVRRHAEDVALFVLSRGGDRYQAIEAPAALTGLPVVRAERDLDPEILRSRQHGFRNGHVPITGILSSIALLAAVLDGRDAVVMSNERSASAGNVEVDGRTINHQFSKGERFEVLYRAVVDEALGGQVEHFSLLRPYSELWVARRFAGLDQYLPAFRSCNRAFHQDPAQRLDRWCGECDKCCFIDLILSPFVPTAALGEVFGGREPLRDPARLPQLRTLIGTSGDTKPWECVGDEGECRAAAVLAADREDRADPEADAVLHELAAEARRAGAPDPQALLGPAGAHHVPERHAPDDLLG